MAQEIIAYLIIALAVFFIGRRLLRKKNGGCNCGCGGTEECHCSQDGKGNSLGNRENLGIGDGCEGCQLRNNCRKNIS